MLNYQKWLETPNTIRIAIVQATALVNGVSTIKYLSTHPVTVNNQEYLPVIKGDITISESISTDYSASISYGDIEIANNNGKYDDWLDYVWAMKPVNIYVGSMPQSGSVSVLGDFQQIFSGLINDVDSKSRFSLNLKIRDKLERINTPLSAELLGNYTKGAIESDLNVYTNQYRNNLKPLCFGEVHNITPMLTDVNSGNTGSNEYMVNKDAIERIIEVRDNGVPIAFTQTPVTGTAVPAGSFRLLVAPTGTVTCSVQGAKKTVDFATGNTSAVYSNTAANIIAVILKNYGQNITGLGAIDLDNTSFNTLGKEPVGLYLPDTTNVLSICQDIAKSCGLVLTITRLGQIKLVELKIPTSASVNITESDMFLNTLTISQKIPVVAGFKLGYARNFTVQSLLNTGIPQQFKDLFAQDYLESIVSDTDIQEKYSTTTVPAMENTYLIAKTDADSIAKKKLDLFKTPRKIITMTCVARLLSVQIGDAVKVTADRFNLKNGAYGLVVSTNPNWLKGTINIGVLI
jgi:hypothetical protein